MSRVVSGMCVHASVNVFYSVAVNGLFYNIERYCELFLALCCFVVKGIFHCDPTICDVTGIFHCDPTICDVTGIFHCGPTICDVTGIFHCGPTLCDVTFCWLYMHTIEKSISAFATKWKYHYSTLPLRVA